MILRFNSSRLNSLLSSNKRIALIDVLSQASYVHIHFPETVFLKKEKRKKK